MANALIWEFSPPRSAEEKEFAVAYFRQLHFVQGFQSIFLPKKVFSSIKSIVEPGDSYVKPLPKVAQTEKRILENFGESLDRLLWTIKKTDVFETGLASLLATVEVWVQARKLDSAIVLPSSNPTSNCAQLMHLLVGKQTESLACFVDDVEYWFFSHFADLTVRWPYFLNFNKSAADLLEKDPCFLKHRREIVELRRNYLTRNITKSILIDYKRALSNILVDQRLLIEHMSKKYREEIILMKASVAPSLRNLEKRMHPTWKSDSFGEMLEEIGISNGVFTPYYINFDFYPSELLKSINSFDLLSGKARPFGVSQLFKTGCKKEMELAIQNYRERMGIKGS
jgi:hypothetical protein